MIAAAYEYDAFGNTLRESGSYAASNPFRFATKYTDIETGLVQYNTRYYSSSLGRFINRDTIGEAGGLNLYAYVSNRVPNAFDRLGMDPLFTGTRDPYGDHGDIAARHLVLHQTAGQATVVIGGTLGFTAIAGTGFGLYLGGPPAWAAARAGLPHAMSAFRTARAWTYSNAGPVAQAGESGFWATSRQTVSSMAVGGSIVAIIERTTGEEFFDSAPDELMATPIGFGYMGTRLAFDFAEGSAGRLASWIYSSDTPSFVLNGPRSIAGASALAAIGGGESPAASVTTSAGGDEVVTMSPFEVTATRLPATGGVPIDAGGSGSSPVGPHVHYTVNPPSYVTSSLVGLTHFTTATRGINNSGLSPSDAQSLHDSAITGAIRARHDLGALEGALALGLPPGMLPGKLWSAWASLKAGNLYGATKDVRDFEAAQQTAAIRARNHQ